MCVLLENLLRRAGTEHVREEDVRALAAWPAPAPTAQLAFMPARVLMQDLTGVPAVVDMAALRNAVARRGADPARVDPLVPVDLVIDHSVQVDAFGSDRPTRATSSASTSATASATSCCAGRSARSATSASCRPGWASATR